mgnify:CR=1 FL=1
MMLYPAINELNKLTDSRYTLVVLTAKRARDIIDGKPVLTDVEAERPVSLATNEIAEGLITYKRSDEHDEEVPAFENFELDINCETAVASETSDEVQSDAEAEEPAVDETGLDA